MNSSPPSFSVIIPTYNRGAVLRRCLKSLEEQTCFDFEVIVGDDGSTDRTREVVSEFQSSLDLFFVAGEHSGLPAVARNRAAAIARGGTLLFLDSDDVAHPTKIELLAAHLDQEWEVIYHPLVLSRGPYLSWMRAPRIAGKGPIVGSAYEFFLSNGNPIPLSGSGVRRRFFQDLGGFSEDTDLKAVEDFDLWLRAAHKGALFHFVADPLGRYLQSRTQISRSQEAQRNLADLARRHLETASLRRGDGVWMEYACARHAVTTESRIVGLRTVGSFWLTTSRVVPSLKLLARYLSSLPLFRRR